MAESTKNNYDVSVQLVQGVSKKTGNTYEALEIKIGDYKHLVFPTPIERSYIAHVLEEYNAD